MKYNQATKSNQGNFGKKALVQITNLAIIDQLHFLEHNMNIRYGRVFNLGNYETERIEVEDEVREGETFENAIQRLRKKVAQSAANCDDEVIEF